ncbi:MAG: FIG00857528: hypothetical protein [uncultured Microvirga sp.]|uniref:DUF2254 domain-containing protein n=1 Tax=uncultured Microvirga sp. TaxID=412392 RepID=A0A6J4KPK8_9HYPH|nr:MAG: FIG00857528: hypothetical protein [uncultured Microvirga sp.]
MAQSYSPEARIPPFLSATLLYALWDRLRTSFWFLPSVMAAAAIALSFVLVRADAWPGAEAVREFGWLYRFGPEGARAILSAIASSMITVAGLTFSITMLTLQLASSQFGPRLLRDFMRDRGNQLVLGTFISTFAYCLLVLRTVRGTEGSSFVPHLAVLFGVLLALASIAVLIYFIHHIATSIRVETLLAQLATETRAAIDRLYPERLGHDPMPGERRTPAHLIPADFENAARRVQAERSGYVQRVDAEALMRLATEHDLLVRVEARPGRFVTERDAVLMAHPSDRVVERVVDRLHAALVIGQDRTPEQDLEFSIRRIVEIAQRALSPGINDPTTALYCIDRLGEAFRRMAGRDLPSPLRFDDTGHLRIITEVLSLDELACPAFAALARYGIADQDVVARLLSTMDLLQGATAPEVRRAISQLSEAIRRESEEGSREFDRVRFREPGGLA